MVAALSVRVRYGASPGTLTGAVTGVDLISADNGTNSLTNRQANPVPVGTRSFEKFITLYVDTAPANAVSNFKIWGDGGVAANTTLYWGTTATYATPVSTNSTIAINNWTGITSGAKGTWDAGSYSAVGNTTNYLVLQLEAAAAATPGNWTETASFSYDET